MIGQDVVKNSLIDISKKIKVLTDTTELSNNNSHFLALATIDDAEKFQNLKISL